MKNFILTLFLFVSIVTFGQEQEEFSEDCNSLTLHKTNNIVVKNGVEFTGKCTSKNTKNTILLEKNYTKGLLTGYYKVFFENGKIKESIQYVNNIKQGKYLLYSEDGNLIIEGSYKNNLKNSYWKTHGKSANVKKYDLGVEKKVMN